MKPRHLVYKKNTTTTAKVILLIYIFFIFYAQGCTLKKNYAQVLDYKQDWSAQTKYYQVERYDTLYSIGFRSGYGYRQLAAWNKITPPYVLKIGQKLKLFQPKKAFTKHIRSDNKPKKFKPNNSNNSNTKKPSTLSTQPKKPSKLYWAWPLKGRILKKFSKTNNKGIDIDGKIGQDVKSTAAGKVVYSGNSLPGYGNLLIIKHNDLYLSAYANNSRLLVKEGQFVKKQQVIAKVGRVRGKPSSLHFEIRKNGEPINPLKYLPKTRK